MRGRRTRSTTGARAGFLFHRARTHRRSIGTAQHDTPVELIYERSPSQGPTLLNVSEHSTPFLLRLKALGFAVALVGAVASVVGVQAAQPKRVVGCSPLRLSRGFGWSEPTGQASATFVVTNTSGRSCAFDGYPTIVLVDGSGRALRFTYHDGGDQMITSNRPRRVVVRRGGRLFFAINKYRCDFHETAVARAIRVQLPGSSTWLRIRLQRYPVMGYCGGGAPSGIVSVSPLVASLHAAAAKH
jgi:hypothetical protein